MADIDRAEEIYLLDTHVWLWAFQGERERFSRRGRERLERAAVERRTRVSAISVWEIARAVSRGRVTIDAAIDVWLSSATAAFAFGGVIPIDSRVALESTRLPDLDHKDPGDRFLVASARGLGARLVTVDGVILRYGTAGHVRVLDPSN